MLAVFIVSVSKALIDRHVLIRLIIQAIPENTNRERKTIFEESLSIQTPLCGWQIVELARYKGAYSLVRFVLQVEEIFLLSKSLHLSVLLCPHSDTFRGRSPHSFSIEFSPQFSPILVIWIFAKFFTNFGEIFGEFQFWFFWHQFWWNLVKLGETDWLSIEQIGYR